MVSTFLFYKSNKPFYEPAQGTSEPRALLQ